MKKLAIMLLVGLSGCGLDESRWAEDMGKKCHAMAGEGVYLRGSTTYECWHRDSPFSLKIEINKEVGFKASGRTLLFTEKYRTLP